MYGKQIAKANHEKSKIRSAAALSTLGSEEAKLVQQLFSKREYAKDEVLLLEGQAADFIYFIYSGKVRIVKRNEEGREQIISIHSRNEYFGEMSLLDGQSAPATIIVHEDAVIGLLAKNEFDQRLLRDDEIIQKFITILCDRIRDSWEMIKILSFNTENAQDRVISLLQRLGELHGVKDSSGVIIDVKLAHQQIADYAALTRETVSRVMKKLEREGQIRIMENKVVLLNNFLAMTGEPAGLKKPGLPPDHPARAA